jgi:Ca-activated chloride channel family protein
MNDPISIVLKPIYLFLLVLIGIVPAFHQVHAETEEGAGKVLFILDASGSMWGKVEGKDKIVVAKEVMINLVKELPDKIEVGLQAYGHRSKGDCNDIEVLVPIGGAKETVIQEIQSINPKGKTPITKSFEVAGKKLKGVEEQTTVILISDGKETCGGDPCTLVKSLRQQGIHVRVHVVGFDVNKKEREQLVCIADAGGGRYFSAQNAMQLKEAFTEVKKEVVKKVKPSKPTIFGEWDTNWGEMVLQQSGSNINGNYKHENGKIAGVLTGNIFDATWLQDSSGQRCSKSLHESHYWGRVRMVFDDNFSKFSATWSYCNEPLSRTDWSGSKR